MERDEKKRREAEMDKFWEIDDLIPARRAPHYAADTETVEITLEPPSQKDTEALHRTSPKERIPPADERPTPHFIPPHTAEEVSQRPQPLLEYVPDNALIRNVRIYAQKSTYRYYEGFVRDARRLYGVRGAECGRMPFFSYVPQYNQMNRAQLEWYLWWRENIRNGVYLDTDYSYVLLYLYELINLSEVADPTAARAALCSIWVRYREIFRQLDGFLPEWICDYSLLHRLPPPDEKEGITLASVMPHCTLKEFYVPMGGEDGCLLALLAFCSNYDYKKSKFYTKQNATLFDEAVTGALREVTSSMSRDGKLFSASGMDDSKMVRESFTGALRSHAVMRRIEVEYCSFSRSHELRYFITDVVKYTENQIRAVLGVRSRLTVYALPTSVRELLDRYLASVLPAKRTPGKKAQEALEQSYEKLYDLPQKALSLGDAAEIERLSWETTERLVEAFEEPEDETAAVAQAPVPFPSEPIEEALQTDDVWRAYRPYLAAVAREDRAGSLAAVRDAGLPEEVLADEINAMAADLLGDILLEECEGGFAVIEDYRDTLFDLLQDT